MMSRLEMEHRFVRTNGVQLHVVEAGPRDGRAVILLHGFPEFWRGWMHQILPLAEAGFHVIVPDQRGYNLSEVPRSLRAYTMPENTQDILCLLGFLWNEKA